MEKRAAPLTPIRSGDRVVRRLGRPRIGTVVFVWDPISTLEDADIRWHPCATVRWEGHGPGVEIVRLAALRKVEE